MKRIVILLVLAAGSNFAADDPSLQAVEPPALFALTVEAPEPYALVVGGIGIALILAGAIPRRRLAYAPKSSKTRTISR